MGHRSISAPYPTLPVMVLVPVYTDVELDDIEKEVAPLAQDLPAEIEDESPKKLVRLISQMMNL